MRTLFLALALALVAPVAVQAQSPTWMTDYAAAYRKATTEQRPLAVVFGEGADGWQQLVGGGTLTPQADRELNNTYVPCYVDMATPEGKAVAQRFEMKGRAGVVLSDRSGTKQAYWHDGTLPADTLAAHLTTYRDRNRIAATTDINPTDQASYYPPMSGIPGTLTPGMMRQMGGGGAGGAYPAMVGGGYYPSMGGSCPTCSGGSCASGNCGGGGRRHR